MFSMDKYQRITAALTIFILSSMGPSSLFAKVPVYGFPIYKGFIKTVFVVYSFSLLKQCTLPAGVYIRSIDFGPQWKKQCTI